MSIFSNFKINSLRKKIIEGDYELRLEKLILALESLPQRKRLELATSISFSGDAGDFAKSMIGLLFNPEYGVFRNDVGNLNEFNFKKLYEILAIWYSWKIAFSTLEGEKNQAGIDFCINSLEICLNINSNLAKTYYEGLDGNPSLANFALYRWCMLCIGHIDTSYESLHENSQDCQMFTRTIISANDVA